jgi:sugar-specific transcriptional regulator TrmB
MMADDSEFITRLVGFGLSEKEALLYFNLLKYGPKSPSMLAKSLKTYREDVHRTLTGLIDKGMVNPSLDSPTVYSAVELDIALDAAVKKHESELREMEMKKQELQDLSKRQRLSPSDEFTSFKIIKTIKELIAVTIPTITSIEEELLTCVPIEGLVLASLFGVNEAAKQFIERGGHIRVITDIPYSGIEVVQEVLDIGEEVRHFSEYRGIIFGVLDNKICLNAIDADIRRISLDESTKWLWTDDPIYAQYLTSTFNLLWEQSTPAEQRIEELLKEGPRSI